MSEEGADENNSLLHIQQKPFDGNSYARKKSVAHGLVHVALLSENISQLKYLLQVGADKHPFYSFMLFLIITSMILQARVQQESYCTSNNTCICIMV